MMEITVNQNHYIDVLIDSDENMNLIYRFANINRLNMLELYDHYISKVEEDIKDMKYEKDKKDEDVEIIQPLNQFMTHFTLEFKYASEYT
ncbi:hypothetical protein IMY05_012G0032300 [Salix suchowensis]|nr:hypothetical protein IMY05_012G0032300 [Salix suchowensis]